MTYWFDGVFAQLLCGKAITPMLHISNLQIMGILVAIVGFHGIGLCQESERLSPRLRWSVSLCHDGTEEESVAQAVARVENIDAPRTLRMHPIVANETVFANTPRGTLLAVHASSGKRLWEFSWQSDLADVRAEVLGGSREVLLWRRVFGDGIHSQLSSYGELVFTMSGDNYALSRSSRDGVDGLKNSLVALNCRFGEAVWELGGLTGGNEPKLTKTMFLGAPISVEDKLYALILRDLKVELVALNPNSGMLLSTIELASIPKDREERDTVSRLLPTQLTSRFGRVICLTSCGIVAAIDVRDHSLVWQYEYNSFTSLSDSRDSSIRDINQSRDAIAAWPTSGDKIIIQLPDSEELHCIALKDGNCLWKWELGTPLMTLVGIYKGYGMIVDRNSLLAIDVESGKTEWKLNLNRELPVIGTGAIVGGNYFYPTVGAIVQVDLENQIVTKQFEMECKVFNLALCKGEIIAQSASTLARVVIPGVHSQ